MNKVIKDLFKYLFLFSLLLGENPNSQFQTDEFGNVYISINVIGHVKKPGTYVVYENTDIITIISKAGGFLPGANLDAVVVYSSGYQSRQYNIKDMLVSGKDFQVKLKANDSIYIKQTILSKFIANTSLLNSIVGILNLYFTISNNR